MILNYKMKCYLYYTLNLIIIVSLCKKIYNCIDLKSTSQDIVLEPNQVYLDSNEDADWGWFVDI